MSTVTTDTTIFKERRGENTKSLRQLTQGVAPTAVASDFRLTSKYQNVDGVIYNS